VDVGENGKDVGCNGKPIPSFLPILPGIRMTYCTCPQGGRTKFGCTHILASLLYLCEHQKPERKTALPDVHVTNLISYKKATNVKRKREQELAKEKGKSS
jgi:hypothetical protein